jgi:hypothetical protein
MLSNIYEVPSDGCEEGHAWGELISPFSKEENKVIYLEHHATGIHPGIVFSFLSIYLYPC